VSSAAISSVLTAVSSRCDLVVVDLGRAGREAIDALLAHMSVVVLVVPARVRSVAAARRLLPDLSAAGENLQLAVRLPSPAGLDPVDIQAALGLPLLGEVPHDPRRAEHEENGVPPRVSGGWQRLAEAVLGLNVVSGEAA
jgi:Flp pilus assembly CpaE family ATPase